MLIDYLIYRFYVEGKSILDQTFYIQCPLVPTIYYSLLWVLILFFLIYFEEA
mgnify:CR=1 FL=1